MFKNILNQLLQGDARPLASPNIKQTINETISQLINKQFLSEQDLDIIGDILHIGNIVYNNLPLDDDQQIIDNGVYDILLEKYRNYGRVPQVGAEPINFIYKLENTSVGEVVNKKPLVNFYRDMDFIYEEELLRDRPLYKNDLTSPLVRFGYASDKKYRVISHNNPTLVGTLNKVKYVLNSIAEEKGVINDPSVKILERDFFLEHFKMGIINRNTFLRMVLELKYDGMSVVVTVRNGIVIAAVSRGDTGQDKATDLTPILYGYRFTHLPNLDIDIDIKCEAVMTYNDLYYYNQERGYDYKNCRSAIIGLFSSNDGYQYQKYVTLVPLAVAPTHEEDVDKLWFNDRMEEITFINKYLITKEQLRYSYIEGNYEQIMFLIKKFVDEAEYARPMMPCMYDGVVLSYVDNNIREALGRENFVNLYSVAIKFNALKKLTTLIGISYTVGQDGKITPMAHYQPIEFLGSIHTKSSIASVARFNLNHFKIGNTVEVEYRNDVMPYLTTPILESNVLNPNPEIEFIKECPVCATKLVFSSSGKSAICPNMNCKGRAVARMANMMDKLGLKDFAEASMEKIGKTSLTELMSLTREDIINIIGEVNSYNFIVNMNKLKNEPIYDFQIVGALGFSSVAQETWKKIFYHYNLGQILFLYDTKELHSKLIEIKGIGPLTINTIEEEFPFFYKDLCYINSMPNVVPSKGLKQKTIRVTGFRNAELLSKLCEMGYDASDKGVTKDTDILLIPKEGHKSSKISKAGVNTLIIPVQDFIEHMDYYLAKL